MCKKIYLEDIPILKNYSKLNLSFPINYDESLAFIGECIRVEGSLNKGTKSMSFGNSDISLLKEVERILKKFNCHIYRTLHISVKIPKEIEKKDVKIVDLISNTNKYWFNIRHSNRFGREIDELIFIETKITYGLERRYRIYLKDNFIDVKIKIPQTSRIIVNPKDKVSAVIQIIFANFALREIFRKILEIPEGRKSRRIYVPNILQNSSKSVIASAISAVLACEGFVTYLEPPKSIRSVGIEMTSNIYVEQLKKLFGKLGIMSYINYRKNRDVCSLRISGKENLVNLQKTINFVEPIKNNKLNYMLSTYRNFYNKEVGDSLTLNSIKKLGKSASIKNIAKLLGRKERTIKRYTGRLVKEKRLISSKTKPVVFCLPKLE